MHLMRYVILCLLYSLCIPSKAQDAYSLSKVYDGDTVELQNSAGKLKLRLTDIDAPERNQEFGQKSRRALSNLCKGNNIRINVEFVGKDKYDRNLGRLQCNQTDASLYLAQHGYAWHNEKYSNDPAIKTAAAQAREKRIGLWSSEKPTPPWLWRQLNMPN
jgi:endonuclease YncB( thermonuclease family)